MNARSREMRNEDSLVKAERSAAVLAKDNHRLQTAYNEVTKATERELKQMKEQYEANLSTLGKSLELTQTEQEKKLEMMEAGREQYESLTKSAIRGSNQMRREQAEKLTGLSAALDEKQETLRRREGVLKCQIDVAHENTDRVLLQNDELQSAVDRLTREKRALERDLGEANESFDRSQNLCREVEEELEAKAREVEEVRRRHKAEIALARNVAENEVMAERSLAVTRLQGEQEAAVTEVSMVKRELETMAIVAADHASKRLEEAEERYRQAQACITQIEAQFVQVRR